MVRPLVDIGRLVAIFDALAVVFEPVAINLTPILAAVFCTAAVPIGSRLNGAAFDAAIFAPFIGNGDTFLLGGVHRLKILLLDVDGVESILCRGDSDPFEDADDICEVLDALLIVRRINVDDFCNGISMFVLLFVTLRACSDVVRLNGIFDTRVFVFFGDVGSETMTGISPSDGSSLMNVL